MSPHEHFLRAESLLDAAQLELDAGELERASAVALVAQGHAILAQIGTPLSWQSGRPATLGRPQ